MWLKFGPVRVGGGGVFRPMIARPPGGKFIEGLITSGVPPHQFSISSSLDMGSSSKYMTRLKENGT